MCKRGLGVRAGWQDEYVIFCLGWMDVERVCSIGQVCGRPGVCLHTPGLFITVFVSTKDF